MSRAMAFSQIRYFALFLAAAIAITTAEATDLTPHLWKIKYLRKDSPRKTCLGKLTKIGAGAALGLGVFGAVAAHQIHTIRTFSLHPHPTEAVPVKLAVLGDSLSTNFRQSSVLSLVGQFLKGIEVGGAFVDVDPSPESPYSLAERISSLCNVSTTCFARPGALYLGVEEMRSSDLQAIGIHYIDGQIRQLKTLKECPNLILLWAGHNDLHIQLGYEQGTTESHSMRADPLRIGQDLSDLASFAAAHNQRTAIVVFGLTDPISTVRLADSTRAANAKDPNSYPSFPLLYSFFLGFHPNYQSDYVRDARHYSDLLQLGVARANQTLRTEGLQSKVIVYYSDALSQPFEPNLSLVNPDDGIHPSNEGKNQIAAQAFHGIEPALIFLGVIDSSSAPPHFATIKSP